MTNPSSATEGRPSDTAGHGNAARTDAVCADLIGILDSVDIPIVVVTPAFTVARFNRPAAHALCLTASHIGQSPQGIDVFADVTDLQQLCDQVVAKRTPFRREVRHGDSWFVLRIAPYPGDDDRIGGIVLTLTNVTTVRASVEQAIYEREYTKAILNTVIEPLVVLDADLRVQTANRAFYDMFHVSRDESHGVPIDALPKHAWEAPGLWSLLKESVVDNKEFQTLEVEHNFPAIGRRALLIEGRLLVPKGSVRNLILVTFKDISERKKAEGELRSRERLFRGMLDALPMAIYTTDAEGRITHFNPACVEFSGRAPIIGSDHWSVAWKLFYPNGKPMPHEESSMAIALKEGRNIRGIEAIAERPDGTRVWFEPYPTILFNAAGELMGGINMLVDITARKKAGAAEALLASIVHGSEDAIISKGLDGIISSWNRTAERLFGYTAEEAIGQPISILFPPDRLDEEPKIIERIKRGERVDHFETVRLRKDGSPVEISLTISPLIDASGRIVGASKVARDITELKRVRAELREAKEVAEAANKSKDRFLAALSHELRTPLNPILMTAAAIEMNPKLPALFRDDIAMIRRNVELETKLIDDLLDLSRVIAGKLTLNIAPIDVNEAVGHVCTTCRPFILEKAIHLQCHLPETSLYVNADPTRLQQVLWNLLRNAAKFTPERGDIYVNASKIDGDRVRVQIRDTGIGISSDVLTRIFNAFEQGDANITRQFGGMGLGLAISKSLIEMHHGTIRAESGGRNRGATFTVELPLASAPVPSRPAPTKQERRTGNGLRVLLVDDHADTTLVLSKLLSTYGHKVLTAGSAAAALDLADREQFDVVVSDIGLPDATGYELMQQIKLRHSMKGIAMSGYGLDEDVRKSREAGFSDHVVKPANVAQLEQTIRRVAGQSK